MNNVSIACQILVSLLLAAAAFQDVRTRTISNGWPLAILALFPIAYGLGVLGGPLLSHGLHFVIALVIGMALFALGWFGGGDAKLYAAIALWFPLSSAIYLFFGVVMAGLVLAIGHLAVRMFQSSETRARAMREGKIAYGVAIAAGAILSLPRIML